MSRVSSAVIPHSRVRLFRLLLLVTVLGVGVAIRSIGLVNRRGLTTDEAFSLALAQRPLARMFHLFTFEANGIVYPTVDWPLVRAHESLFVLRFPALVAGVLAIVGLYFTAARLFGRAEALVAAFLLAVNPVAVQYSYLARAYIFGMLFGTLSYACLVRAGDNRLWWIGYTVALVLAGYSNAFSVPLLLAAQAVYLAFEKQLLQQWALSVLVALIALIPLILLLLVERSRRNALYWMNRPSAHDAVQIVYQFTGNRKTLAVAGAVVVAAGLSGRLRDRRVLVVAAWAIVPLLALFMAAQVTPVFSDDYLIPIMPGLMLLLAVALMRLPPVVRGVGLVALAGLFFATSIESSVEQGQGWNEATRAIDTSLHHDPVIFDIPDGLVAAGVSDMRFAGKHGRLIVNEWSDRLPPGVTLRDDPGGYGHAPPGPPGRRLLARLARKTGTVYLVVNEATRQGDITRSRGVRWARRACDVRIHEYGEVQVIRIGACNPRFVVRISSRPRPQASVANSSRSPARSTLPLTFFGSSSNERQPVGIM